MRVTRIFVGEALATTRECVLTDAAATHLARVLRATAGDQVTLFDGRGGEYAASVTSIRAGEVRLRVGAHDPVERESGVAITLAQGVSRGERMDWVIQKATELGVTAIVPVLTERSVVRLDARQSETRRAHWRAVAIAACEQCGRNRVPTIAAPTSLATWLASPPQGTRVMLGLDGAASLSSAPHTSALTLLIGPEGGLSPDERALAGRAGFASYRLGPRVLRTETAAIAALSVLQTLHGDLGAPAAK
jgi:16S rRNA (uracil1498-N3)-methyltransferase